MTETGWVIELGASSPASPAYFAGKGWSSAHQCAVRFCRREDAEKVHQALFPLTEVRIAEHQWG